jgi:hypothetical protein
MAFNRTSQASRLVNALGGKCELEVGMTVMASGTGTVTSRNLKRIDGIVGIVQGATGVGEMVICTATSGNTATLETVGEGGSATGTSVVMWIAWGLPRL